MNLSPQPIWHHSCTALTTLVDIFYKNINKNEFTGVLFVDFAKAFDVIDHDLLLRKLTLYGLSNDTLHLISSFLSNREQLVCINTIKSDFLPVKYGIPQGSVLGPLLFSLYINDLPLFIKALCELFADDTTIHSSHSNLNNLLLSLQESINNLFSSMDWTKSYVAKLVQNEIHDHNNKTKTPERIFSHATLYWKWENCRTSNT